MIIVAVSAFIVGGWIGFVLGIKAVRYLETKPVDTPYRRAQWMGQPSAHSPEPRPDERPPR